MRKFLQFMFVLALTVVSTGCGMKLANDKPCTGGSQCLSTNCSGNVCVGKPDGAACVESGECASAQCGAGVCVPQTCNPPCQTGDICLGTAANRCEPASGSFNGDACLVGDSDCRSVKCNMATHVCEGRSDGSYCVQNDHCNAGSACVAGVCQPAGSTCNPTCLVGQRCANGTCNNVLLGAKDACIANANCGSGFCDPGPRYYWTCRPGQSCTPTYPAVNTVTCGTPVLPNNGCGSAQNGTGTLCGAGLVCNGTSCIAGCTPTYPSPTTITCGQPVLPNNGCGSTPNGTGTLCGAGFSCNGTSCVSTSVDGAALYTNNCASCHGPLATSTKRGRSSSQISAAIAANTGGMGSLSGLTSVQIEAISTALSVANFTVTAPASLSVTAPATGSTTVSTIVTVSTPDNTAKTVTMSVIGMPTGVSASFNPVSGSMVLGANFTPTMAVTVASTVAAGTYPLLITGTSGNDSRTFTMNLVVTTGNTGGGAANGTSCNLNTDCASLNCGPLFGGPKTCNGKVDIDQVPPSGSPFDCHSGSFIAGTNRCAPQQFSMCSNVQITVTVFTDTALAGSFLATGTRPNYCFVSTPSLNHRVGMENGDLSGCRGLTFWTPSGGNACVYRVPNMQVRWNEGRDYSKPL